jgi:hypothetical protein
MKKSILIVFLIMLSLKALSQENIATLRGGYSFATIEDTDIKTTGWRINGTYEFNPIGTNFAHGVSFGFIHLTATDGTGINKTNYRINSYPIYYSPKFMFGTEKIKAYVKGVLGIQISGLNREGLINLEDTDFGFYGGGGGGLMFFIKENIFINAEYEIAWASNGYYKDGWINSAMGGIGFKF